MKTAIVFAAICVVLASARTLHRRDTAEVAEPQIVKYQNDNNGVGPYNFVFETSDGQKREEHAQVVIENDEPVQVVSGSYSFVGTDGAVHTVNYTADKNGFHPEIVKSPIATQA